MQNSAISIINYTNIKSFKHSNYIIWNKVSKLLFTVTALKVTSMQ